MDAPGKFAGKNNHAAFVIWVETVCTWMRAQFYGGTSDAMDWYRITILKTLLSGSALETATGTNQQYSVQILQYLVRSPCKIRDCGHGSASVPQFRRRALQCRGRPTQTMDALISASRRMREPMTESLIAKRFLFLLPDHIHDKMVQDRGLTAEYSSLLQLKSSAHQLWDTDPLTRGRARNSQTPRKAAPPAKAEAPKRGVLRVDNRTPGGLGRAAPDPSREVGHPHAQPAGPNTNKRCFRCGNLGHIGSDPTCPKFEAGAPRVCIGVAAQRVIDSYDEGEYPHEDPDEVTEEWAGTQYDPVEGDDDPNEAPDLGDLIDLNDDEDEITGARVAAMRLQYYSLRVNTIPDEAHNATLVFGNSAIEIELGATYTEDWQLTLIRERQDIFSSSATTDLERICIHRAREGLEPLTEEQEESRLGELREAHRYPAVEGPSFAEVALDFQTRQGHAAWSRAASEEWDTILLLDEAESARLEGVALSMERRGNTPAVSATSLARPRYRIDQDVKLIEGVLTNNECVHSQALSLADRSREALDALDRRPAPLRSQVTSLVNRIRNLFREIVRDMEALATGIALDNPRQHAVLDVLNGELGRRLEDGSAEAFFSREPSPVPREETTVGSDDDDPVVWQRRLDAWEGIDQNYPPNWMQADSSGESPRQSSSPSESPPPYAVGGTLSSGAGANPDASEPNEEQSGSGVAAVAEAEARGEPDGDADSASDEAALWAGERLTEDHSSGEIQWIRGTNAEAPDSFVSVWDEGPAAPNSEDDLPSPRPRNEPEVDAARDVPAPGPTNQQQRYERYSFREVVGDLSCLIRKKQANPERTTGSKRRETKDGSSLDDVTRIGLDTRQEHAKHTKYGWL
ncbi:hypothetical protein B0H12DRAFT_1076527 [Mycena haematopus]|nr:hypothetical protein B0H12DRAFT_1076527 [Mycena haematopus]